MDPFQVYIYFVRHIIPGPQSLSYFATNLLLPIALLTPRSILSRWQSIAVFVPVMVGCTIHAWTAMGGVDVPSLDMLLWALFLLVFKDPWTEFAFLEPTTAGTQAPCDQTMHNGHDKMAHQLNRPAHTAVPYPITLRARIPWTFNLVSSLPLDNWVISYRHHDRQQPRPPAAKSRKDFILIMTLHATLAYIIMDLTCAFTTTDPYFTDPSVPLSSPLTRPPHPLLSTVPPRILRPAIISLQAYALIANLMPFPAVIATVINAAGLLPDRWSPHTWPPYFGPPKTFLERGLSGWWGAYWHQTMRWAAVGPGMAVADGLRLAERGLTRRAVVLMSAFGFSGCVHMGLVPPEPLHLPPGGRVEVVRLCVAGFFWVQVVGMLAEDVAWRVARAIVSEERRKGAAWWWTRAFVNVVWLFAWFCCCMPLLGEAGRQLGWWRHWLVPVSVWRGLRGEGWVTWEYLMN